MPSPAPDDSATSDARRASRSWSGSSRSASMTPRVMGSEVLPAACRFSNVVLRVPETSSCKASSFGLVLLLDQRRQPDARAPSRLGAGIAGALHLFPENPRRPFGRLLRRGPGLARQTRATGRRDGRCVGHAAAVDQVVACAGHVADHPDGRLARAAGIAAHPPRARRRCRAASRPAVQSPIRHPCRHRIAQRHALGHLAPAIRPPAMSAIFSAIAARQLGAVEIQPRPAARHWSAGCTGRIGALDDQRRQRCHGAGGALDHVAHDLPESRW